MFTLPCWIIFHTRIWNYKHMYGLRGRKVCSRRGWNFIGQLYRLSRWYVVSWRGHVLNL